MSFGAIVFDLECPGKVNPGHTGFQWPISPNLFKITTELLLMMDRKSYMNFHLAQLSLTLSDLESRSHRFSMAYISKSIQDNHKVTIDDG